MATEKTLATPFDIEGSTVVPFGQLHHLPGMNSVTGPTQQRTLSAASGSPNARRSRSVTPERRSVCMVCGDDSPGVRKHYGAISCEACKCFFRRSVQMSKRYTCNYNGKCPIGEDKRIRHWCQKCRFQKCLEVGMRVEAVKLHRASVANSSRPSSPNRTPNSVSPVHQQPTSAAPNFAFSFASSLDSGMGAGGHLTLPVGNEAAAAAAAAAVAAEFLPAYSEIKAEEDDYMNAHMHSAVSECLRTPTVVLQPSESPHATPQHTPMHSAQHTPMHSHHASPYASPAASPSPAPSPRQHHSQEFHLDAFMHQSASATVRSPGSPRNEHLARTEEVLDSFKQRIIFLFHWAKTVEGFEQLFPLDQKALLRASVVQIVMLGLALRSSKLDGALQLHTGKLLEPTHENSGVAAVTAMTLAKISGAVKLLNIDDREWALLKEILLFNPEANGVRHPMVIREKRRWRHIALLEYTQQKGDVGRFGELMLLLPPLVELSAEVVEQLRLEQFVNEGETRIDASLLMSMMNGDHYLLQSEQEVSWPPRIRDDGQMYQ